MNKIVSVTWKDHYSQSGWFESADLNSFNHINISVGFLVQENDEDYLTIAQTKYLDGNTVADVLHILKENIITIETLQEDGLYYENTSN